MTLLLRYLLIQHRSSLCPWSYTQKHVGSGRGAVSQEHPSCSSQQLERWKWTKSPMMDQETWNREQQGKAAGIQRNAEGDEWNFKKKIIIFFKVHERPTRRTTCPQSARLSYGCCSARSQDLRVHLLGVTVVLRLLLWLALLRTCQTLKHRQRTMTIHQQCCFWSKRHWFTELTHHFTLSYLHWSLPLQSHHLSVQ